jgi:hypothetical protein
MDCGSESLRSENKELVLIGTVHGDPDGMLRLLKVLRLERPSLVAVEVSPYGLSYRKRNGRRLRSRMIRGLRQAAVRRGLSYIDRGQVQAILAQLSLPFGYRAALRFCRDSGAVLWCLDLSEVSRRLIQPLWQELLDFRNLETLLALPSEDHRVLVRKAYVLAARLLRVEDKAYLSSFVEDLETDIRQEEREASLAQRIEKRYTFMDSGKLVYVGGWQHLIYPTRPRTLSDRLMHLRPRRLLLAGPWGENEKDLLDDDGCV